MNQPSAMRHLLWKDIKILKPLILVAFGCIVVFNMVCMLIWPETRSVEGWSIPLWLFVPNLVAFGSAAMLVGTDEDAKTMDWLRTLPIHWSQIAISKLIVAFVGVVLTWIVASIMFFVVINIGGVKLSLANSEPHPVSMVFYGGFFCALLLFEGFVLAWGLRSSLVGLILLLPIYFVTIYSGIGSIVFLSLDNELTATMLPVICTLGLFAALLIQHWAAYRRLTKPIRTSPGAAVSTFLENASPAPRSSSLPLHTRPSPSASLLWQQIRQTGLICVSMLLLSVLLTIAYGVSDFKFAFARGGFLLSLAFGLLSLAPVAMVLFASWFGAATFYGDNQRRRCAFFADRGVSPSAVWWTRMLPPAFAFLAFLGATVLVLTFVPLANWTRVWGDTFANFLVISFVCFAFGQLASQWIDRPLLAFLAAPALAFSSLTPLIYLVSRLNVEAHSAVLVVPVLLFATWRLTQSWLENRDRTQYTVKVLCYISLAVAIPCIWVLVSNSSSAFAMITGN